MVDRLEQPPRETSLPTAAALVAAAVSVFAIGVSVYLLDRPAGYLRILPATWGGVSLESPVYGALGGVLPSFSHAFAFSILTAAVMRDGWTRLPRVCMGWAALHGMLEIGQAHFASHWIESAFAPVVAVWEPMDLVPRFFTAGTFDPGDLCAASLGALAAGLLGRMLVRWTPSRGRV